MDLNLTNKTKKTVLKTVMSLNYLIKDKRILMRFYLKICSFIYYALKNKQLKSSRSYQLQFIYYFYFSLLMLDKAFIHRYNLLTYSDDKFLRAVYITYVNQLPINNLINEFKDAFPTGKKNISVNEICLIGPNYNIKKEIKVELAICLKPYMPCNIKSDLTILIINDSFYNSDPLRISEWCKKYKATIVRHTDLNLRSFDCNASLMGFQRALHFIHSNYYFNKLIINGFDLNTSNELYSKEYPTLLPNNHRVKKKRIVNSLARHDYLLNLYFVKIFFYLYKDNIDAPYLKNLLINKDKFIISSVESALK